MNGFLHRCRVERGPHTVYSAGCVNNIFLRGCECGSVTWVGMKATRAPAREVLVTKSWRAMAVFPWRVGGLLLILATLLPLTDAQLGDWETTTLCIHDSSCQLTTIYFAMILVLTILTICLLNRHISKCINFALPIGKKSTSLIKVQISNFSSPQSTLSLSTAEERIAT